MRLLNASTDLRGGQPLVLWNSANTESVSLLYDGTSFRVKYTDTSFEMMSVNEAGVASFKGLSVTGNVLVNGNINMSGDLDVSGAVNIPANSLSLDDLPVASGLGVIGRASSSMGNYSSVTCSGNRRVLISNSGGTSIAFRALEQADLPDGGACSLIGRSANSSGPVADVSASTNDRVLMRKADALSFEKVPVGAIDATGTPSSSKILLGNGSWGSAIAGPFDVNGNLYVAGNLTLDAGGVTLPPGVLSHSYLAAGDACSIFGRAAGSAGVMSSIESAADGDVIFRENATIVFDNWIRQRRNIMRGFWEFETGNGDPSGTSLADGDRLHGTPFVAQRVGNGLISQASRGSTYTRNCVTLGVYSVNDEAGIFTVDANASSNGLPVGIGHLIVEMGLRCNTLSASLNDYILNLGFVSDSSPTGRGVYFQYDRATSGNVWRLVAKNSSQTTSVSSSTVAASTEYRLRIEVTASNLATFYVNGTSVGTVTSNIPSLLSLGAMMKRNTSSAGAVAYWDIDYIGYQLALSTPRSSTTR